MLVLLAGVVVPGFEHTGCFNSYGEPTGVDLPGGKTGSMIQGYTWPDGYQLDVKALPVSSSDVDLHLDCFDPESGTLFTDGAGAGHFQLGISENCVAEGIIGLIESDISRVVHACLAICEAFPGCEAVQVHKPGDKSQCMLFGNTPGEEPIFGNTTDTPCSEFTLQVSTCATRLNDNEYLGTLCPAQSSDPNRYALRAVGPPPPPPPLKPWRIGWVYDLGGANAVACDDAQLQAAAPRAVLALDEMVSLSVLNASVECTGWPAYGREYAMIVWVLVPRGNESALQATQATIDAAACGAYETDGSVVEDAGTSCEAVAAWHGQFADNLKTELALAAGADLNVSKASASSWTLDNFWDAPMTEYPSCFDPQSGAQEGVLVRPDLMAAVVHDRQVQPENHKSPPRFRQSDASPDDFFPIPDGCFNDATTDGTPSNRALKRDQKHYDLLDYTDPVAGETWVCTGDRSQEEMLQICLTICAHVNFGDPGEVDSRCIGVNYDEHGYKGHCHLQSSDYVLAAANPTCAAENDRTDQNFNGVCMKDPGVTPRPGLCGEGAGAGEQASGCGLDNTVAIFCHFSMGDAGPHQGRTTVCGTGSGWNEEEQECQVCAEASYSSGERDPRFEPDSLVWSQTSVPRPADSPSIVNVCRVCPPGRFCARAVGCSWTDSSASCPALCPTGHKCPEGTADPLPCTSSEYQDETGQSACKECPTKFGLSEGSDDLLACLCENGKRRATAVDDADEVCVPCGEGLDCQWVSEGGEPSVYVNETINVARHEQINAKSQMQTVPWLLENYWASENETLAVLTCDPTRTHPDCVGGNPLEGDETLCLGSRFGRMCALCPDGEQALGGGGCATCEPGTDAGRVIAVVVVVLLLLLFVHWAGNSPTLGKRLGDLAAVGIAGMLLEFVQALAAIHQLKVIWSSPFKETIEALDVLSLQLQVLQPSCIGLPSPQLRLTAKVLVPLVLVALLVVVHYASLAVVVARGARRPLPGCGDGRPATWAALLNSVGTIFLALYTTLSLASFSPFVCFEQPDGQKFSFEYDGVVCSWEEESAFRDLVGIASAAVLVYPIGLLVLAALGAREFPRAIAAATTLPSSDPPASGRQRKKPAVRPELPALRFLFIRWRSERYYYTVPRLLRNLLIAFIPTCLPYDRPDIQIVILSLLIAIALVHQIVLWPWRREVLNYIDAGLSVALLQLLAVAGAGAVVDREEGVGRGMSVLTTTVLAVAMVVALLFLVLQMAPQWFPNWPISSRMKILETKLERLRWDREIGGIHHYVAHDSPSLRDPTEYEWSQRNDYDDEPAELPTRSAPPEDVRSEADVQVKFETTSAPIPGIAPPSRSGGSQPSESTCSASAAGSTNNLLAHHAGGPSAPQQRAPPRHDWWHGPFGGRRRSAPPAQQEMVSAASVPQYVASSDEGASWTSRKDVRTSGESAAPIGQCTPGMAYQCTSSGASTSTAHGGDAPPRLPAVAGGPPGTSESDSDDPSSLAT